MVKLQDLNIIAFRDVEETFLEISLDLGIHKLISCLSGFQTIPILSYLSLDLSRQEMCSRTRKVLIIGSPSLKPQKFETVKYAAGFSLFFPDKTITVLMDPVFLSAVPHLMRGAVAIFGLDADLRINWNKDGGLSANPKVAKPVLIVDGKSIELEDVCRKCAMHLHRATGACKLLGQACLMQALPLFGGRLYHKDTETTCHEAQEWMVSPLGWSGKLDGNWFVHHRMNLKHFK